MKKTFAILLTMAMLVSMLTVCGKNENTTPDGSLSTGSPAQNEEFSANEPTAPAEQKLQSLQRQANRHRVRPTSPQLLSLHPSRQPASLKLPS